MYSVACWDQRIANQDRRTDVQSHAGQPSVTLMARSHQMYSPTMSSWDELVSYLRSTYRPAEDTGEHLEIFCRCDDGDPQLMIVEKATNLVRTDEVYATIRSPIAAAHYIDADTVLKQVGRVHTVGGLVRLGDTLYLRHAVPLSSMALHDFVGPFQSILTAATELHRQLMPYD